MARAAWVARADAAAVDADAAAALARWVAAADSAQEVVEPMLAAPACRHAAETDATDAPAIVALAA